MSRDADLDRVAGHPGYAEQLRLAPGWWAAVLTVTLLVAASVHGGAGGVRSWLPYAVLLPLGGLLGWAMGRTRIRVADGHWSVLDARIPVEVLGEVHALDPPTARAALRRADPMAYVVTRGWVRGAVWALVDDPEDDTPYWLVSSNHPEELAAALRTARDGMRR